ncbi:MAG: ATP-binding protein [Acidimicrobiia bacterium]
MTVTPPSVGPHLVGRDLPLARLHALLERLQHGEPVTAFVAGEAGIGKTSLIRAAVWRAAARGVRVGWGTCIDVDGAPGYWPWTQALDGLVREVGVDLARREVVDDAAVLASIVPSFGHVPYGETSARSRLLLMDAVSRFLQALAAMKPLVVVLDDLQWADESSLDLLDFLARAPRPGPVALIAAYRHDELPSAVRTRLGGLLSHGEHLAVTGLDLDAVVQLVEHVCGHPLGRDTAAAIHRRSGGHPFFARELALLASTSADMGGAVPAAVRETIERRLARLPETTVDVLSVLGLLGTALLPDVAAAALERSTAEIDAAAAVAIEAGVLVRTRAGIVFVHDLWRETVVERVPADRRRSLHQAIGTALEEREARGGDVPPSEIARHFIASVALDGPDRAVRWALAACSADVGGLAFVEAAGHLRRLRAALADAAVTIADGRQVDLLVAEADALARGGNTIDARGLLRHASVVADRARDPARVAAVALATARLGARFAARRDDVVRALERALDLVSGVDDVWEARLAATLARELQHSVPEDRPRAGPLSERALALGRRAGDNATLRSCLLARHDVLWTPGTGAERAAIAGELISVALAVGDEEGHAEGLLLLANALLEQGSPAYEASLEACIAILGAREQPQHRYTAATRRACLALLRGRLEEAEALIEEAAELGTRIREPDTGNVRMSQRLELVRARDRAPELRAFAAEAVEHWTGAPVHAHAVAAGFFARAGDLDASRQHVGTVVELGTWRADRSYLWSVFVRELAVAAIAVGDRRLATELLEDLTPLADTCGVNGAVVAFAGSHAHSAGLLAAALGHVETSRSLLAQAAATYDRLGAVGWLADVETHPAPSGPPRGRTPATMRRRGPVWQLTFAGREATVAHSKGLADIARLLASAGGEVHVLDLVDASDRSGAAGDQIDRRGLAAYRRRLADLEADIDDAERDHDSERRTRFEVERQAVLEELRRVTGVGGRARAFANHPAERARKAVAGRVRDAIRKLEPVLPELAAHLHRNIVTGTYCRYRPELVDWQVDHSDQ